MAFAPVKGDRPEWAVQKLAELGVDRIVVMHSDRSVVRWSGDRAASHIGRFRTVARQAVMQSRQLWLPDVAGPEEFAAVAGVGGSRHGRARRRAARPRPAGRPGRARGRLERGGDVHRVAGRQSRSGRAADRDGGGGCGGAALRHAGRAVPSHLMGIDHLAPDRSGDATLGVDRRPGVIGEPASRPDSFGVYVHVPFCTRRCDYCAFATWTDRFHLADAYVTSCADRGSAGGGVRHTAGLIGVLRWGHPIAAVARSAGRVSWRHSMPAGAEVTVECNPETVDAGQAWPATATPASPGCRSACSRWCRTCWPPWAVSTTRPPYGGRSSRGGGRRFADPYSVDLIFGGAGETLGDWAATVTAVLALDPAPAHVSAYALTVEPGTPLASDPARHPDPDDQADKYLLADPCSVAAGLEWYEISNWARPGADAATTSCTGLRASIEGSGAPPIPIGSTPAGSARRWWNVRTPERYIRLVEAARSAEAAGEDLDEPARRFEALELALRTRGGVPQAALPNWESDEGILDLVEPSAPGRLVLTLRGRLLANEVAVRLRT